MTSPVSTPEDTKKKFVPKRRAPYLMQDEIIQKNLNKEVASIAQAPKELVNDEPIKKLQDKPQKETVNKQPQKKVVNKESKSSQKVVGKYSSQLVVKSELNYHEEVSKLYGIQKRIAHYFVNCCITRRELTTGAVTAETLCGVAGTTKKTLKKIIQRMIEKRLIVRIDGKRGKGGFSIFRLEQGFVDVVRLQLDLENNHLSVIQQNENRQAAGSESQALPQEWQDIDFTGVEEIGFGLPQIRQMYNKNVNTPETIQASINHFSFVLQNKPEALNKYKNKLATFMSVLQKGGAWVDNDYMSPQEIAFQKLAEQKKARIEKLKKLEEEFLTNEFDLWISNLTEEEKNKIIPNDIKNAAFAKDTQKNLALKNYFKNNLWQNKMPEELKKIKAELAE